MLVDPNLDLKKNVLAYIGRAGTPRHAVLITGPWGVGKTFIVKGLLDGKDRSTGASKCKYVYVSLFGISSRSELHSAVIGSIYPLTRKPWVRLAGSIAKSLLKMERFDTSLKPEDFANAIRGAVFVFDDLERVGLTMAEILGCLNEFVEHDGAKVLVLANEAELENNQDYTRQKEKVFGATYRVSPDTEAAIGHFLTQIDSSNACEYLRRNREFLAEIFAQSKVETLRILQQSMLSFEEFHRCMPEFVTNRDDAFHKLAFSFIALGLEIKKGRLARDDLSIMDGGVLAAMQKRKHKGETSPLLDADDRYPRLSLCYNAFTADFLRNALFDGAFDAGFAKEVLASHPSFADPENVPAWRRLVDAPFLEEDRFVGALAQVDAEIAKRAITIPGEILHIVSMKLWCSDAKLVDRSREDILLDAEKYVRSLANQEKLPSIGPLGNSASMSDGYGGLRTRDGQKDDFVIFRDFLLAKCEEMHERLLRERTKELLRSMKAGSVSELVSVLRNGFSFQEKRVRVQFLNHADPNEFAALFLRLDTVAKLLLVEALQAHIRGIGEGKCDKNWLMPVCDALEEKKSDLSIYNAAQIDAILKDGLRPLANNLF